ncbi:MAG: phosphoribosyltransferase family protein [Candidatus Komeilibacteria bacterium]
MDNDFINREFKTGYGVPPQDEQDSLMIFEETGALLEGHFLLTSGRHSAAYINKDAVFPWTEKISRMCSYIANYYRGDHIEVVAAPALGGIILSQWVAHHLTNMYGKVIHAIYAEKVKGMLQFKRGYDKFVTGKNVLVVEDILTTGGSVQQVVDLIKGLDGKIIKVHALWNRGNVDAESLGVDSCASLLQKKFQSWSPDDCPLCKEGIPINTNVGKGKK